MTKRTQQSGVCYLVETLLGNHYADIATMMAAAIAQNNCVLKMQSCQRIFDTRCVQVGYQAF